MNLENQHPTPTEQDPKYNVTPPIIPLTKEELDAKYIITRAGGEHTTGNVSTTPKDIGIVKPNNIRAGELPVIKQIEQPTAREDDEIRKIALKFLDKLWTKGGHLDGQTSITIKKNLLYDAKLAKEKIPRGLAFTALGSASLFVSLSAIATTAIPIAAPLIFAGVGAAFLAGGANTLYNSFKCWKNKKDGLKALKEGGYDTGATNN